MSIKRKDYRRAALRTGYGRSATRLKISCLDNRRLSFESLEERRLLAITVDTPLDIVDASDNFTSLREAIAIANTNGNGGDRIDFSSTVFTGGVNNLIRLNILLTIDDTLTIDGLSVGGVTISGDTLGNDTLVASTFVTDVEASLASDAASLDDNTRVINFLVDSGELTLNGVTITGGRTTGLFDGGGIFTNDGSVILNGSTVSGNSSGDDGGGISTLRGSVILNSSTISGNSSANRGGAIRTSTGDITLINSTVTANRAGNAGGVFVANNALNDPSITIENSIVAGNIGSGTNSDLNLDSTSVLTINHSLIGNSLGVISSQPLQTAISAGVSNLQEVDPLLGPLADHGGPTPTHALRPSSPAIDAGHSVPTVDQRGQPRPLDQPQITNAAGGNGSDIGAFEFQGLVLVVTTANDELDNTDTSLFTADPSDLSLREAITIAQGLPSDDAITFDPSVFTGGENSLIRLTLGQLEIFETLTIDSSSATGVTITGDAAGDDVVNASFVTDVAASFGGTAGTADDLLDDNSRVIDFAASPGGLTLIGLTITGGRTTDSTSGGGIRSSGSFEALADVTLIRSTVSGNSTAGSGNGGDNGPGGGIYARLGNVTLNSSTVSENSSLGSGGGIRTHEGGVTVNNSTVSGNQSNFIGGGIYARSGPVTLTGSTLSGNQSRLTAGGVTSVGQSVTLVSSTVFGNRAGSLAGGVLVFGTPNDAPLIVVNSIVAGNLQNTSTTSQPNDLRGDPEGELIVTNSLIGINTSVNLTGGAPNPDGNFVGTIEGPGLVGLIDPILAPLANNGGPTLTHALLPGSPAINNGDSSLLFDQRGLPRDDGNGADIGAFELQANPSADFDTDGDVDGSDFLVWQRGFGSTFDASDLVEWQDAYGLPPTVATVAQAISDGGQVATNTSTLADVKHIDAAIALATLESNSSKSHEYFQEPAAFAAMLSVGSEAATPLPATDSLAEQEAQADESDETSATNEPWLNEELLEAVFG